MDHYRVHKAKNKIVCDILKLKTELINLLIKYHLKKNGKSNFSLDVEFLKKIGFEECNACRIK